MATKYNDRGTPTDASLLVGVSVGPTIPVNYFVTGDIPISIALVITGGGTSTSNLEGTLDNITDPTVTPVWFPLTGGSALSANTLLTVFTALRAVRHNMTAFTSGGAYMKVLQGDAT